MNFVRMCVSVIHTHFYTTVSYIHTSSCTYIYEEREGVCVLSLPDVHAFRAADIRHEPKHDETESNIFCYCKARIKA